MRLTPVQQLAPPRKDTMPRIATPQSIEASPKASQPLLQGVRKQLGSVPNLFRLVANSSAALEGDLGLSGALAKGRLDTATGARIALAVAEINGCNYCLAPLAKNLAKLDDAEIAAARAIFVERAAADKVLLATTHMLFPGLGRIVKDGSSLRWMAADWSYI
jgi:AhpD family alkylhydroperoxidase